MKILNMGLLFISIYLLAGYAAEACDGVSGWRHLKADELKDDGWRNLSSTGYARVDLDVNGDGLGDNAFLVVSEDGSRSAIEICLGSEHSKNKRNCRIIGESENIYSVMGLDGRKPGCHEFYEDYLGRDTGGKVCSTFDVIDYFRFGSASSFFIYDSTTDEFHRYWESR